MKTILSKHRPENTSKEDFDKMWSNMQYGLTTLYKAVEEMKSSTEGVKSSDFDCPNHYAKLAYELGKKQAYQEVIDLLPDGAKII